jgi:hypothetical protein
MLASSFPLAAGLEHAGFAQPLTGQHMPTIQLTGCPTAIMPAPTLEVLWEMEIFAHALYPQLNAGSKRKSWVERIQRQFAKDYTDQVRPPLTAIKLLDYWFTLFDFAKTQDEIGDLKTNKNRDLQHAARILILCTQDKISKAKARASVADECMSTGRGNSTGSAEKALKQAWREYSPGCHLAAASLMLASRKDEADKRSAFLEIISLAEHLRVEGEGFIPTHGSLSILDPRKTWKVPASYPLLRVSVVSLDPGVRSIHFEPALNPDNPVPD